MVMTKLVQPKRILGLFILGIVAFGFSIFPTIEVEAEEKINCEDYLDNLQFKRRYNAKIERVSGNTYKISFAPQSNNSSLAKKLRDVEFEVTKINGQSVSNIGKVSYKNPLTIQGQFVNEGGLNKMSVEMQSTESSSDPNCEGTVTFTVGVTNGGEPKIHDVGLPPVQDAFSGNTDLNPQYTIDCSNVSGNSFEALFCAAKNKAQGSSSGSNTLDYTDKFNDGATYSSLYGNSAVKFQCDYKTLHKEEDLKGDNYYVNKSYLYGSGTYNMEFGTYKYHFAPGEEKNGSNVSCKVKCEESVEVEYGPPVASKAGLCFEYKIKVTSRVSCSLAEKPEPPEVPGGGSYCTPVPWCTDSAGTGSYQVHQGGPNQDFDNCVKKCDGGKYTDKCSKKCYKEVYGKKGATKTDAFLESATVRRTAADKYSLSACIQKNGGCYYRSGGTVDWSPSPPEGRWYTENGRPGSTYYLDGHGIYRELYSSGVLCDDICWWEGCDGEVYLNPGFAEMDKEDNQEIYDQAVAQCNAAASCNSSTATFTISVDYTHNTKSGTEDVTIDFPYSKQTDKLASLGVGNDSSNTASKDNSTLLGYDGCYKDTSREDWYQAEWSFPGTWINNKTGEITYVNKDKTSGWQSMEKKFCIPLDAKDVNTRWWNYYYNKMLSGINNSTNSDSYSDICHNNSNSITNPSSNIAPDKWNIHGNTKKFGYFDWNIDVECFYALNTNPANVPSSNKTDTDKCNNSTKPDYRVRPVDLENLFPATDGSKLNGTGGSSSGGSGSGTGGSGSNSSGSGSGGSGSGSYGSGSGGSGNGITGRTPGFNWSEYATNTKNPAYTSFPSKYVSTIQKVGYTIYSDNYLDYEFVLTTDALRKMRNKTKNSEKNYTKFEGQSTVGSNGVTNYKSTEIRSGDLSGISKKLPTEQGRLCNNMVNYSSTACANNN